MCHWEWDFLAEAQRDIIAVTHLLRWCIHHNVLGLFDLSLFVSLHEHGSKVNLIPALSILLWVESTGCLILFLFFLIIERLVCWHSFVTLLFFLFSRLFHLCYLHLGCPIRGIRLLLLLQILGLFFFSAFILTTLLALLPVLRLFLLFIALVSFLFQSHSRALCIIADGLWEPSRHVHDWGSSSNLFDRRLDLFLYFLGVFFVLIVVYFRIWFSWLLVQSLLLLLHWLRLGLWHFRMDRFLNN